MILIFGKIVYKEPKRWENFLPLVLWAYCTLQHTSTQATSFHSLSVLEFAPKRERPYAIHKSSVAFIILYLDVIQTIIWHQAMQNGQSCIILTIFYGNVASWMLYKNPYTFNLIKFIVYFHSARLLLFSQVYMNMSNLLFRKMYIPALSHFLKVVI